MSDPLVFMMGKFESTFPTDRLYAKNHTWAQKKGELYQFGFTAYAVRLLQDVYFLEWHIDNNTPVTNGQEIGFIESSKAESDLYAPKDGNLVRFNPDLMNDPSLINVDLYGQGWLFEIDTDESELLSPDDYMQHLESVWEVTQRTIKGQLNE
ncbi:MAG: glycine cleavage system protein H [Pirellulales bacterium]